MLVIFIILNLFGLSYINSIYQYINKDTNQSKESINSLLEKVSLLRNELTTLQDEKQCTTGYEESLPVNIEVKFYEEVNKIVQIPGICNNCIIKEVGVVTKTTPNIEEINNLKYFTIKTTDESNNSYFDRILTNNDYSKIYPLSFSYSNLDITNLIENNVHVISNKYSISLTTNLLPDEISKNIKDASNDLEYLSYFKSDNNFYFFPLYNDIGFGDEYDPSDIKTTVFDTCKGVPIYVSKDNPDDYFIETKEHLFARLEFVPSLAVHSRNNQYPITWNGNIKNTYTYDYGYDSCGKNYLRTAKVNKDELKITGYQTNTEKPIYEYANSKHPNLVKMYNEDYLPAFTIDENEQEESLTYSEFINEHPIIFWEDETGRIIMFYNTKFMLLTGGCAKPAVYLYPESEMKISVSVIPTTGHLTFTYPRYTDKWSVISDNTGKIKDKNGNTYKYLWWESTSKFLPTPHSGFVIRYDELNTFLDNTLKQAGFNDKEISDFKEFWIPTMTKTISPYYKISFLQNEEVNAIAKLEITPKPTTEIRLFMIYERLNEPIKIDQQKIINTVRNGFTVTEWGGTRR